VPGESGVVPFSLREKEGPAPPAWEDEGFRPFA